MCVGDDEGLFALNLMGRNFLHFDEDVDLAGMTMIAVMSFARTSARIGAVGVGCGIS
jgi:hypothetical protein